VDAGDQVICFCLSSGVSGSYQSACVAAQEFEGKVFVVDTKQFCISELIIVERAVQMRDSGMSAPDIYAAILDELQDAHVLAIFNTLEYLKLGGRISSAAAFAGGLLSLKPVLTIEDGVVKILGKARGSRNGNNMLIEFTQKLGGIDFDRPYCFGYTGFSDETLQKYIRDSAKLYTDKIDISDPSQIRIAKVGATIGTYAGPGAIAVAFFSKK
jgi:DegV family protein with EDD domain